MSRAGAAVVPADDNSPACTDYVLAAIDAARTAEHVGPLLLPHNWYRLTIPEQLFVVTNLERTARGLLALLGIVPALSHAAALGAVRNVDPWSSGGIPVRSMSSILADASPSPLAADYLWLYNDGWGGTRSNTPNIDCTSSVAAGCWGHRLNILGRGLGPYCHDCQVGVAYRVRAGEGVYTEVFVRPMGRPAPMSWTWRREIPSLVSAAAPREGRVASTGPAEATSR